MPDKLIKPEQLRVGLYVHLDLPWMKHPFMTSSFKIRTEQQLKTLRQLGLADIRMDPARSDVAPLEMNAAPPPEDDPPGPAPDQTLWAEKQRRILILKERRTRLNRCANRYRQSAGCVRQLMERLFATPAEAMEAADTVVGGMVEELTGNQDVTVQLVNLKGQDENAYFHVMNVAALSLILGQKLGLDQAQLRLLGLGALFHDLGHQQIPTRILRKKEPLTPAEEQLYRRHPLYGRDQGAKLGILPREVLAIIAQHHEYLDGGGFPEGLRQDAIVPLARIVALVNRYDNLCNRNDPAQSLSPYEAVSLMYARERQRFDPQLLTLFITNMGVYPPGTVVTLSDGRLATVISINPRELLKPNVLVYSPDIPKEEALILNLTEEDLSITGSCHRNELRAEVLNYLNLSENVSYYFERPTQVGR